MLPMINPLSPCTEVDTIKDAHKEYLEITEGVECFLKFSN